MIYFVLFGVLLTAISRRNPLLLIKHLSFRAPALLLISFFLQILLSVYVNLGHPPIPLLLEGTFIAMIVGLLLNRSISGVKLIAIGSLLNVIALIAHGGLMPVSSEAMHAIGRDSYTLFGADARHQAMGESKLWWLGDWIPFLHHVFSPGDLLVGFGLIQLIISHSPKTTAKEK